jgi:hypothetical protein
MFLLHSAGVLVDDAVVLFSGPSGVGKSTIVAIRPDGRAVFTADQTFVDVRSGAALAHATPVGDYLAEGRPGARARLGAVFFLEQGAEDRIRTLPPATASIRLLENSLFRQPLTREEYDNLLDATVRVGQTVPCYELVFSLHGSCWELIERALRSSRV